MKTRYSQVPAFESPFEVIKPLYDGFPLGGRATTVEVPDDNAAIQAPDLPVLYAEHYEVRFTEKTPPASIFSHLSMEENLDGVAVLCALPTAVLCIAENIMAKGCYY